MSNVQQLIRRTTTDHINNVHGHAVVIANSHNKIVRILQFCFTKVLGLQSFPG